MTSFKGHAIEHAHKRAVERYKFKPCAWDYEEVRRQIVQGKAELVDDQVLKKIYKVKLRGDDVWVVFNTVNKRVVTFLPKNPRESK